MKRVFKVLSFTVCDLSQSISLVNVLFYRRFMTRNVRQNTRKLKSSPYETIKHSLMCFVL